MKKVLAIVLALVLALSFAACAEQKTPETDGDNNKTGDTKTVKVGLICIGDENDQGYTYNFIRATETAKEALAKQNINVEWVIKYNLIEGDPVAVANEELVEEGCSIIFNNSYGQEPAMLQVAPEHPEVQFVGMTNEGGKTILITPIMLSTVFMRAVILQVLQPA